MNLTTLVMFKFWGGAGSSAAEGFFTITMDSEPSHLMAFDSEVSHSIDTDSESSHLITSTVNEP